MIIYHILVVRDRSADVYGTPSFHLSVGAAARGFSDEVNRADANNVMYRHPEDFDLFELGTYDDTTGLFSTVAPRQVAVGKDVALKRQP